MKLLPLIALLVSCHAPAVECVDRVSASFVKVKPMAVAMLPVMSDVDWSFKWYIPKNTIARVWRVGMSIEVNQDQMCKRDDIGIDLIMAHEFGHLIARAEPMFDRYTPKGWEDRANYYGARLLGMELVAFEQQLLERNIVTVSF